MNYTHAFAKALQALRDEGRYRVFADIRRDRGQKAAKPAWVPHSFWSGSGCCQKTTIRWA